MKSRVCGQTRTKTEGRRPAMKGAFKYSFKDNECQLNELGSTLGKHCALTSDMGYYIFFHPVQVIQKSETQSWMQTKQINIIVW